MGYVIEAIVKGVKWAVEAAGQFFAWLFAFMASLWSRMWTALRGVFSRGFGMMSIAGVTSVLFGRFASVFMTNALSYWNFVTSVGNRSPDLADIPIGNILDIVGFIDIVFPITFFLGCLSGYISLRIFLAIYRTIISAIPNMST